MSILISNLSPSGYTWDGIHVSAGQVLDVTGWDISGVIADTGFIKLVSDSTSGVTVIDTTASAGSTGTKQGFTGPVALQALQQQSSASVQFTIGRDVLINGVPESFVTVSDLSGTGVTSNVTMDGGYF